MEIGRHSRAQLPLIRSWLLAFGGTALGRLVLPQSLSLWAAPGVNGLGFPSKPGSSPNMATS